MSNSKGPGTESPPPPPPSTALDLESGAVGGDATIMSNPDGPNTQKVTKSHSPPHAPVDLESRSMGSDTTIISNPDGPNKQKVTESLPPPPAAVDLESRAVGNGAALNIVQRWKREDFLKKCLFASRGLGFVFSFLAYIIMASNKHGDWKQYDQYEEYRYLVEISILSALYTGLQSLRQIHEISTGKEMFSRRILALVDFCGDQIIAYLLISVASSAVALTNAIREWSNNAFTNESATSISMEFFAFFALAFSSLISGYMLSQQFYI